MSNTFTALLLAALLTGSNAHSFVTKPVPRGSNPIGAGCGAGLGCKGPCDSPKTNSLFNQQWVTPPTVQRGQNLPIEWFRANHPGGFVRLAIAPLDQSDTWSAFNNAKGTTYFCFERGCGPTNPSTPNGTGDGTCKGQFTIPSHLADGRYTIQWLWFGGGTLFGQQNLGFGEYYACTDVSIKGGAAVTSTLPPTKYAGGDFSTGFSSGVCKYWSSNKVGDCSFPGRAVGSPEIACSTGASRTGKPYPFAAVTGLPSSASVKLAVPKVDAPSTSTKTKKKKIVTVVVKKVKA
ncbi:hypothetical protein HK097_011262 [Rhizophlyctis rosea]|uniref:Lytic polysaccharide monooxygenase 9 n=1 Tax=Rhizophlyctis rosea TaxID=64517 RepID=A0AAD5SIA3_9FUNG|nr:hypothetical protein HK097_011262 [Rhizophlyctis rosea]